MQVAVELFGSDPGGRGHLGAVRTQPVAVTGHRDLLEARGFERHSLSDAIRADLRNRGVEITRSSLIARGREAAERPEIAAFMSRLQGIVVAREYVMVEYDAPEHLLEMACMVTPGIESPTVAPLSKKGWIAVKSMAKKSEINQIVDKLADLGAKGIIITDIRTCRI